MSAVDLAVARLKVDEGFRATLYTDTTGHATIGYGFNVQAGITEKAAAALLAAQTEDIGASLSGYWWASGLDDARMSVVVEVAFNIGLTGLLHFVNMLSAIGKKDWPTAKAALLDSDAARELPARYKALAQILVTGIA
jgi:lysozyme